jgi:hypothetical protein
VAFLHLVLAVAAHAQSTEPPDPNRCYPIAPARVDVRLKDGTTTRGTIVCLGPELTVLTGGAKVTALRMSDVTRIAKPADPIWDGALKGAAVGAAVLLFCAGDCSASVAFRAIGAYSLAGALIDSVDSHTDVLYQNRSKGISLGYRWKF